MIEPSRFNQDQDNVLNRLFNPPAEGLRFHSK